MKKYFLLIILLIFSWFNPKSMAQFKMPEFEVYGGGFYNRLLPPSDSINVFSVVSPFAGIGYVLPLSHPDEFFIIGAEINQFGSRTKNGNKYLNFTVGPFARYKQQIYKGISYGLGAKYNISVFSGEKLGAQYNQLDVYSDVVLLDAGLFIRIQKNFSVGFKYELPAYGKKVDLIPSFKIELLLDVNNQLFGFEKRKAKIKEHSTLLYKKSNTAMVIMLSNRSNSIKALNEAGLHDKAKLLKKSVEKSNLSLYSAAKSELTVYPLYFIFSDDLERLIEKKFEGIFLNEKLERDSSIVFNQETFLIGRMGYQISGESRTIDSITYPINDYNNFGFYIYDQNFKLLNSPFPVYIRSFFYPKSEENQLKENLMLFSRVNWRIQTYLYELKEHESLNMH